MTNEYTLREGRVLSALDLVMLEDLARGYEVAIERLKAERDTYKRIAERNHRANLMPCPSCGHRQAIIHEAAT